MIGSALLATPPRHTARHNQQRPRNVCAMSNGTCRPPIRNSAFSGGVRRQTRSTRGHGPPLLAAFGRLSRGRLGEIGVSLRQTRSHASQSTTVGSTRRPMPRARSNTPADASTDHLSEGSSDRRLLRRRGALFSLPTSFLSSMTAHESPAARTPVCICACVLCAALVHSHTSCPAARSHERRCHPWTGWHVHTITRPPA